MDEQKFFFNVSAGITAVCGLFSAYFGTSYLMALRKDCLKMSEIGKHCNKDVFVEGIVKGITFLDDAQNNGYEKAICKVDKSKIFGYLGKHESTSYAKSLVRLI